MWIKIKINTSLIVIDYTSKFLGEKFPIFKSMCLAMLGSLENSIIDLEKN